MALTMLALGIWTGLGPTQPGALLACLGLAMEREQS